MRTYVGSVGERYRFVHVEDDGVSQGPLSPRFDLAQFTTDTQNPFDWGSNSARAAQLAFALLVDATGGDVARAKAVCLVFKHHALVPLPWKTGWTLSQENVLAKLFVIEELYRERAEQPVAVTRGDDDPPF